MFTKKIIPIVLLVLFGASSCQKLLIKPDPTGEAQKNFEMFWNDLNNGYPYFVEDGIDWQARHDEYSKLITPSTSTSQLYSYMTQMLKGFSDGHLSVEYGNNSYSNEKTRDNLYELVRQDQSGSIPSNNESLKYYYNNFMDINKSYVSNPQEVKAQDGYTNSSETTVSVYGTIKTQFSGVKNILYVNLATFNTEYSIENLLQSIFMSNSSTDAMILDLRMNEGGSLGVMWNAMSVFLPANASVLKYAYSKEKVGPLPENFGIEKYYGIAARNNTKFSKPIVVLVNRLTVSAAEHATMVMKEIKKGYNPRIKIVGDYTFGATSYIVQRTLPCGIKYTLVNSKTWDANHVIVEKTGIKPEEQVFLTSAKIMADQDEQMERAIEIIKNNSF